MRWNGINDGTIKTFLILTLIAANLAVAHFRASERSSPPSRPREATLQLRTQDLGMRLARADYRKK